MKKDSKTIYLVIGIILIFLIAIFSISITQNKNTLKVGAILGLTGSGSFYSEDVKNGMLLAQKQLSKEGIDLEIIFEDNKTDPKESVTAFNKLNNADNVDMIVSLFSVTSVPLASLANEDKLPLMVSITSAKDIGKNPYVLQYYLKAEDYAYPIAEEIINKYKKIAIIYCLDEFGKSVSKSFSDKFVELGGEIVILESYNISDLDFKTQLIKIKNSNAQAIVFSGFKPHYISIIKNLEEMNLKIPFFEISPNTMYPSIIKEAGDFTEGVVAISLEFPINQNLKFKEDFLRYYSKEPNVASSLGYDMIYMIGNVTKGKKLERKDIIDKFITQKNFNTLNGLVTINEYGEFSFKTYKIKVENGKLVPIE
ncbi:MAG: penicillin-binding protein activator [archaeon]